MKPVLRLLIPFTPCAAYLLLILVTVGPLGAGPPRPTELQTAASAAEATDQPTFGDAQAVEIMDMATATPKQLLHLDGRCARFQVILDSDVVNVVVKDGADEGPSACSWVGRWRTGWW